MIGTEPGYWPVSYAGAECSIFGEENDEAPDQALFERMASELLWNWTGRRFGVSEVELRPKRLENGYTPPSTFEGGGPVRRAPGFGSGRGWAPAVVGGGYFALACYVCSAMNGCSCGANSLKAVELPGPVSSVVEVVVNGAVLPKDTYWLREDRWLVRKDGQWPSVQDMDRPAGEVGTWSVRYRRGLDVPTGGQLAAGVLACELAKAAQGDEDCGLPKRLQSMSREGVSIGVLDPFEAATAMTWNINEVPKISTGIWVIDSWVAGVNVPRQFAGVRSVDSTSSGRLFR
jgi:hypothetical protein